MTLTPGVPFAGRCGNCGREIRAAVFVDGGETPTSSIYATCLCNPNYGWLLERQIGVVSVNPLAISPRFDMGAPPRRPSWAEAVELGRLYDLPPEIFGPLDPPTNGDHMALSPNTRFSTPTVNHEGRDRTLNVEVWSEPDGTAAELRIRIANPDSEHYEEVVVPVTALEQIYEIIGGELPPTD
jgi:hypothetical protein